MHDPDIGNTAIALAHAMREAREQQQDLLDAQQLANGRALLRSFPGNATPAMLARLTDLGDVPNPSTRDLLEFLLGEFRAGNGRAAQLMHRYWRVARDWPEMLPEPQVRLPAERLSVTGSSLDRLVEQAR